MYAFLRKYQSGGLLDTGAMRDDISKSGKLYKDGIYTKKGRRRLAAIQQIEQNQDKGLRYSIDDAQKSFRIIDSSGTSVSDTEGHGIGTGERSGLLYGVLNKERRAKKEVSRAMMGASKYLIEEEEEDNKLGPIIDKGTFESPAVDSVVKDKPVMVDPVVPSISKGGTEEVLSAQQKLKDRGFNPGNLDGIWGPKTQAAWESAYPSGNPKVAKASIVAKVDLSKYNVVNKEGKDYVVLDSTEEEIDINFGKGTNGIRYEQLVDPESGDTTYTKFVPVGVFKPEDAPTPTVVNTPVVTDNPATKDITLTGNNTHFAGIPDQFAEFMEGVDSNTFNLFTSSNGDFDNSGFDQTIKDKRAEIDHRKNTGKRSKFGNKTSEQLEEEIKTDKDTKFDNRNTQVVSSTDNSIAYLDSEINKQKIKFDGLKTTIATYSNVSDSDRKNLSDAGKLLDALQSRKDNIDKLYTNYYNNGRDEAAYDNFFKDRKLSNKSPVAWDSTRGDNGKLVSKAEYRKEKSFLRGEIPKLNNLKNLKWLDKKSRDNVNAILYNPKLNKDTFNYNNIEEDALKIYMDDLPQTTRIKDSSWESFNRAMNILNFGRSKIISDPKKYAALYRGMVHGTKGSMSMNPGFDNSAEFTKEKYDEFMANHFYSGDRYHQKGSLQKAKDFKEKTTVYKEGGLIPKYQVGTGSGGFHNYKAPGPTNPLSASDAEDDELLNEFHNYRAQKNSTDATMGDRELTPEEQLAIKYKNSRNMTNTDYSGANKYGNTNTDPVTARGEAPNTDKIIPKESGWFRRMMYKDASTPEKHFSSSGPLFSKKGINTPLGEIQYNDLAQVALAYRAKNKKYGDVPIPLEKFVPRGARNVLAARDMDSAMLNKSNRQISKIQSNYNGSDPFMAALSNNLANSKRSDAKLNLISDRSVYRRDEEDRVAREMEQKRVQHSNDLQENTAVNFRNKKTLFNAELAKVKDKAARDSKFDQTIGALSSNLQSRANGTATVSKALQTEAEAIDRQRSDVANDRQYKAASITYQNILDNPASTNLQKAEARSNLQKAIDGRSSYSAEEAKSDHERIDRGSSKLSWLYSYR